MAHTQDKVVGPAQPSTVGSIQVEVHIRKLQLLQRVCDTLLLDLLGLSAQWDALVRDHVANRIRLDDDGELQVLGPPQPVRPSVHILRLVPPQARLAGQLTRTLTGAAVPVGQVVQHETQDLGHFTLVLIRAGGGDGRVEAAQEGDGGRPLEGAGALDGADLGGVDGVVALDEALKGGLELLGVAVAHGELAADEGVAVGAGLEGGRDGMGGGGAEDGGCEEGGTHCDQTETEHLR